MLPINFFRPRTTVLSTVLTLMTLTSTSVATPPEPGWATQIVPTGQQRVMVKSTPIEMRPYRPLHVYGNTVRRRYYRGTPLPAPRDLRSTATGIMPTR